MTDADSVSLGNLPQFGSAVLVGGYAASLLTPEWDGQRITSLRLDPIKISKTLIAIDTVTLSSGDGDFDSLPDNYEDTFELDAIHSGDANEDAENDGLTTLAEYTIRHDTHRCF